jgi:hypothetical protein
VESNTLQLIQQGPEKIEDALSLGTHEDSEGADDVQLETMSQSAGPQVVKDDLEPTLASQNDRFSFPCIDGSRQKENSIRVG